jgi:hypothetical protein
LKHKVVAANLNCENKTKTRVTESALLVKAFAGDFRKGATRQLLKSVHKLDRNIFHLHRENTTTKEIFTGHGLDWYLVLRIKTVMAKRHGEFMKSLFLVMAAVVSLSVSAGSLVQAASCNIGHNELAEKI